MRNQSLSKYLIVFVIAFFLAVEIRAQDDPGDPGNSNPGGTPSGWVPIDGGLGFLLTAGLGLGIKRALQSKHKTGNYNSNQ
jgi:hypothetical protein